MQNSLKHNWGSWLPKSNFYYEKILALNSIDLASTTVILKTNYIFTFLLNQRSSVINSGISLPGLHLKSPNRLLRCSHIRTTENRIASWQVRIQVVEEVTVFHWNCFSDFHVVTLVKYWSFSVQHNVIQAISVFLIFLAVLLAEHFFSTQQELSKIASAYPLYSPHGKPAKKSIWRTLWTYPYF